MDADSAVVGEIGSGTVADVPVDAEEDSPLVPSNIDYKAVNWPKAHGFSLTFSPAFQFWPPVSLSYERFNKKVVSWRLIVLCFVFQFTVDPTSL